MGAVHVVSGDQVEFTPFTAAEEPWLFDPGSSQDDGTVYDGRARFADNERYFTYLRVADSHPPRLQMERR